MKHFFWVSLFLINASVLLAHPQTNSVVTHPKTNTFSVVQPRTNATVTRPTTSAKVLQPMTAGGATANFVNGTGTSNPVAAVKPSAPAPSGKKAASGSYTPSYKKSKDFTAKKADQGGGNADGLGLADQGAAQKDADARSFQVQKALSAGDFDKIVPPAIMGKLKQRNHEAAQAAKKKEGAKAAKGKK